jgi:dihydroneopterin aldolase
VDIVFIEDLVVETVIGVYDWERNVRQKLSFDIEMGFDISDAILSDNLKDTLNYAEVAESVRALADSHDFQLLESFTGVLIESLQKKYALSWIKIKVRKLGAVANAASVGLIVERGSR